MPYVLQRAPSGWTSHNDDAAATASNRAGSGVGSPTLEVPATETDAPDARARRHAWARLLARVYEVDPLVCRRCGARLRVISSDPESRANHKDPQPPGKNRSSTAGTRSDHRRLNRLLSAEWNHSSDRAGGSTLGKVRLPAPAARRSRGGVFIEPHPARFGLPSRANLATPACDGRRDRDHRQPLALVLISHDPDAARGALRSFGFSITVPIT